VDPINLISDKSSSGTVSLKQKRYENIIIGPPKPLTCKKNASLRSRLKNFRPLVTDVPATSSVANVAVKSFRERLKQRMKK